MKTIKSFVAIVLLAFAFVSCNKTDYINVVPADATFVASANLSSLAEKGDLGNSLISSMLEGNMSLVFSSESEKQMKKYMESPKDMGIDLREPVYMFQTVNKCVGIAMKMLDKDDFEDFLKMLQKQNFVSKAKERDGIMMGTFLDDMQYGYDGKTILLLGSAGDAGSAVVKQTFMQLFTQDEDKSFRSTESFDKLNDEKCDITFYTNMAALPENVAMSFKSLIPDGVRYSDIEFFSSLDFQKGRAVLSTKLFGNNDKAKKLLEEQDKSFKKIEGEYINMPNDDTFLWACVGVNGEKILPKIKQETTLKQALFAIERAIDIEAMLKAVDGDLAMAMPFRSFAFGHPFHLFCAQLKNSDFLADVDYWQKSMKDYGLSMKKTAQNEYHVTGAGENFKWGVDGKDLFIGTEEAFSSMANSAKSGILAKYEDEIKESMLYAYINLGEFPLVLPDIMSQVIGGRLDKKIEMLHAVIIRSKTMRDAELCIEIGDGKENCLKELLAK